MKVKSHKNQMCLSLHLPSNHLFSVWCALSITSNWLVKLIPFCRVKMKFFTTLCLNSYFDTITYVWSSLTIISHLEVSQSNQIWKYLFPKLQTLLMLTSVRPTFAAGPRYSPQSPSWPWAELVAPLWRWKTSDDDDSNCLVIKTGNQKLWEQLKEPAFRGFVWRQQGLFLVGSDALVSKC